MRGFLLGKHCRSERSAPCVAGNEKAPLISGAHHAASPVLDRAAAAQQIQHRLDALLDRLRLGVDHQIGIQRQVVGEAFARDIVTAGGVQPLRVTLAADLRRGLNIDGNQAFGTDQRLGLLATFGSGATKAARAISPASLN